MGFEIVFHFFEKADDAEDFDREDTKTRSVTIGEALDEVPVEKVAATILKEYQKQNVWIDNVEIHQWVKKSLKFSETKSGGVKIGNKAYLGLYLGLCLAGGIIHLIFSDESAFGASVAISGVVGMYIVLFPENSISCFFLLPRPVTLGVSGLFVISMWFVFDIVVAMFGVQGVTYFSHILGLGAGLGLAVLALKKKWLVMEPDERSLLQMLGWDKKETEEKAEEKESKDSEGPRKQKRPVRPDTKKAAAERAVMETEEPKDEFIRFSCQCGKRIKVPRIHAGQTGRCPRCKRSVKVPER